MSSRVPPTQIIASSANVREESGAEVAADAAEASDTPPFANTCFHPNPFDILVKAF